MIRHTLIVMTMRHAFSTLLCVATLVAFAPTVHGQIYIGPERAYQAQVRRFAFDWSYIDVDPSSTEPPTTKEPLPVEASPPARAATTSTSKGGLRLYFYERERASVQTAIPLVLAAYEQLSRDFNYTPSERFPYILYNTYQEFLETRLFPVQEGVLGVTSPIDLTLTLPYFGDHRRFVEVSTHEMAHQFTIQKLRDIAKKKDTASPIERLPLWFIEGLAEYFAQHGIDPEAELLARDLVTNANADHGYVLLSFFEDRPGSGLWTYKLGQARIAFLEDAFGQGTALRILEDAYLLSGTRMLNDARIDFARLLERVTGENKLVLAQHFADWLKRRAYRSYLDASQSPTTLTPLFDEEETAPIFGFAASPDGNLLLYRRINMATAQTELVLVDQRDLGHPRQVVADGVPGAESLHPVSPRNFDLGNNCLVYVAQVDSRDVIYWQAVERQSEKVTESARTSDAASASLWPSNERSRRVLPAPAGTTPPVVTVRLSLDERIAYDLGDLVSAESPALSPDGLRVAFIGIDLRGTRDVYVLEPHDDTYSVRRLTNDTWAERQLSWGKGGIVYSSNATGGYWFNLFSIDPDSSADPVRLTDEARDASDPLVTHDGRIYFVAYDEGRADIYQVQDARVIRRTDVSTGLFSVSPGVDGGLWALWLHGGEQRPVHIAHENLLSLTSEQDKNPGEPVALAQYGVEAKHDYDAGSAENWHLGSLFGLLGAGGGTVVGQLYASAADLMRDHVLVLNLAIWGNLSLTDGTLLYINQEHRVGFGAGVFHALGYRLDHTLDNTPSAGVYTSYERFYGAVGLVRVPFSTFRYLSASLALGGVSYFPTDTFKTGLANEGLLSTWSQNNERAFAQAEASLSLGHDTLRYHPLTGPLDGSSVLLQLTGGTQPQREAVFGEARLDAATYVALGDSANFCLRAAVGSSFGGRYARELYLSGFDTLRGVGFNDTEYLLGRQFYFSTAELQLPLAAIVRVLFLPNIEAVLGFDFGGVANAPEYLWDKRVLDGVLGLNFVFGPLVLRMHFAKPIATGAHPERAAVTHQLADDWVTNLSLNWLDF